jgi:hypothetical protein
MSVGVLVITDGREDYLQPCIQSAMANLTGPISEWWMYDDTGDDTYRAGLERRYPTFEHFNVGPRQGFGGAIAAAWAHLAEHSAARFVFHLEADFTFRRPVDVGHMSAVLVDRPHLAQLALVRQAWNADEAAAGGVVQRAAAEFTACSDYAGRAWLEHRLFWTTNPGLYRRSLLDVGWPAGDQSEGVFGLRLLEGGTPEAEPADVRFGYWGRPDDPPWVTHIGHTRAGTGY